MTLEAIVARQDGQKYPVCVAGARACPSEDCGGPPGNDNGLAAIRDPDHEERGSVLEWLGGRFDPERFEPGQVKFDDPRKRWKLAFAPPPPARARRDRTLAVEGGVGRHVDPGKSDGGARRAEPGQRVASCGPLTPGAFVLLKSCPMESRPPR